MTVKAWPAEQHPDCYNNRCAFGTSRCGDIHFYCSVCKNSHELSPESHERCLQWTHHRQRSGYRTDDWFSVLRCVLTHRPRDTL